MQISTVYLFSLAFALTTIVLGNAFYKKKQFYPSVVYITKSNTSMAVIYVQFFVMVLIFGKVLRKIFLGTLRSTEFEHLLERFWYALTETCLAFTVFRDDFNPRFVALFTVLLFLKSFHWLAEERVNFMERSPILGCLFHVRVLGLLSILGYMDYILLMHAYNSTIIRGPTVQLVFGFEYGILLTIISSAAIKYSLHVAEMQTDNPWENKAVFLLYTELVIGLIKVILYLLFVIIMAKIYALPMFVFRPMFFTIRNFKKALNDVIMSRRAIRNMNTLYPDATTEELRLSDNICIICRDDMVGGSKKLPCGHIFHTSCLRSWFQRQQTCPTCRLNILRNNANSDISRRDDITTNNVIPGDSTNLPENGNTSVTNLSNATKIRPQGLQAQIAFPNPLSFYAQYSLPLPSMPSNLSVLTDDELRRLEGAERQNIEERLKLLQNIKLLIDASTVLMNQYTIVTTTTSIRPESDNAKYNDKLDTLQFMNEGLKTVKELDPLMKFNSHGKTSEEIKGSDVSIEDIGQEDENEFTDVNELRKRRLKYLQQPMQS